MFVVVVRNIVREVGQIKNIEGIVQEGYNCEKISFFPVLKVRFYLCPITNQLTDRMLHYTRIAATLNISQ